MKVNWWEELNLCVDNQYPDFMGFVAVKIGEGLYMGIVRIKLPFIPK